MKANETTLVGNYRDVWIVGEVADPYSASVVLAELPKIFGKLLAHG